MIVVTGATGHLGNVLVRELLARHQVVRAVVLAQDSNKPFLDLEVEMFPGGINPRPG